ncbi:MULTISPECIES: TraQ conjugal transfer family protein [Bacteroidales]|uniref:TraQ conjugal transfer protein n=1 Tax=Bacteroides eggerthii TaxID=28111 RepID=A0A975KEU4_9BACE|nr:MULTISPECIES: TraQ conjugal transfer family protein [Bacteroidales]QUT18484.1 TraQ conjugal transfer protein [Parabacteroides distasonis]QUT37590.1 TraQ conjugal transfer protein [Bacteroides uniformis]QUT44220.1 TraQ conjugal transfer protein [Bacteroides eggerthii]
MKLGTFIMGCALALPACMLAGCDDRLEVRQAYDFSLSSWYLQEGIEPEETVEIRLTLDREGDYREARYRIGYIQLEGDGEVFTADGTRLVNRELTDLSGIAGLDTTDICRQVFTLFYRNTGEDNPEIRFVAVDNFRVERTLDIPFSIEDRANTDTID